MDKQNMNSLSDRLKTLSESKQLFILSSIFGNLMGSASCGNNLAKEILIDVEKTVTTFENKNSAK